MNSNKKKIYKVSRRKSKKKQIGGSETLRKKTVIKCKKQVGFNPDPILDTFYKKLFSTFLGENQEKGGSKKTKKTVKKTTKTDEGVIVSEETVEEKKNKISSNEFYNLVKDNQVLYTELMSKFYNRCVSDLETQKLAPIILFKNKYLNKGLSYAYLQKCASYLKKYMKNNRKTRKNKILAKRLLELIKTKETIEEKKNLDLFIQSFLTSSEYSNLVSHTNRYCELLLIKKIGNILKHIIMSSQIQVNTKEKEKETQKGGANKDEALEKELKQLINFMYTYTRINDGKIEVGDDKELQEISKKQFRDLTAEERVLIVSSESKKDIDTKIKNKITKQIMEKLTKDLGKANTEKFVKSYKKFMNRGKSDPASIMKTLEREPWYNIIKNINTKDLPPSIKNIYTLILERES